MTGASRTQTVEIVNSIKMAIDETKIPNVTVNYESLDDATAAKGSWDAAQEAENARKAINDKHGRGLHRDVQLRRGEDLDPDPEPGGSRDDLAGQHVPGSHQGTGVRREANEPGVYYPNGKTNYAASFPPTTSRAPSARPGRRSSARRRSTSFTTPSSTARASRTSSARTRQSARSHRGSGTRAHRRLTTTAPSRTRSRTPVPTSSTTAASSTTTRRSCSRTCVRSSPTSSSWVRTASTAREFLKQAGPPGRRHYSTFGGVSAGEVHRQGLRVAQEATTPSSTTTPEPVRDLRLRGGEGRPRGDRRRRATRPMTARPSWPTSWAPRTTTASSASGRSTRRRHLADRSRAPPPRAARGPSSRSSQPSSAQHAECRIGAGSRRDPVSRPVFVRGRVAIDLFLAAADDRDRQWRVHRAHRARLHAGLRDHRADQLRPRRPVHARHLRRASAPSPILGFGTEVGVSGTPWLALLLAMIAAMIFCGVLNVLIERVAYRPLRRAPRLAPLISAIGVSFILVNIGLFWKGPTPRPSRISSRRSTSSATSSASRRSCASPSRTSSSLATARSR